MHTQNLIRGEKVANDTPKIITKMKRRKVN